MMLRCLQRLPLIVALENITENGAWFANLAGGIPLIRLDITTNGSLILSPFPFLPLIFSGLNQGRILLREVVVGLRPPPRLLQQPRPVPYLVARLLITVWRRYCFRGQIHSIPGYWSIPQYSWSNVFQFCSCRGSKNRYCFWPEDSNIYYCFHRNTVFSIPVNLTGFLSIPEYYCLRM